MPGVTREQIDRAKEWDLLSYLQTYEPGELTKKRPTDKEYRTKTHDSLVISNGRWNWTTRGFGGKTALDYLIKVRGINLRDFYPYYTCDAFVEVSDEIGAVLLESKREEKNYIDRLGYHKAYYSLDRGDGIENDAVDKPMTPEDAYIHKAVMAELYAAFASLPDKQAKRLYALFFMGMSRTEIAKAEGVAVKSVCESIVRALETLRKNI